MPLKTIKIVLEYVGTPYHGWQIQPNGVTIQEILEDRLEKITGKKIKVHGSGRTDSGVHAEGQVAHFRTESHLDAPTFQRALNSLLPEDIVVKDSVEVAENFHAQFSQKGKRYRYTILNRKTPSAFLYPFSWHCPYALDVERMRRAGSYLVGEHDFAAFQAAKSDVKTTVRRLVLLEIHERDDQIRIYFEGSGFLKHMVRIITGTLVEVGSGYRNPEEMREILAARDRKKAGRTAPPHGLCLERVFY